MKTVLIITFLYLLSLAHTAFAGGHGNGHGSYSQPVYSSWSETRWNGHWFPNDYMNAAAFGVGLIQSISGTVNGTAVVSPVTAAAPVTVYPQTYSTSCWVDYDVRYVIDSYGRVIGQTAYPVTRCQNN